MDKKSGHVRKNRAGSEELLWWIDEVNRLDSIIHSDAYKLGIEPPDPWKIDRVDEETFFTTFDTHFKWVLGEHYEPPERDVMSYTDYVDLFREYLLMSGVMAMLILQKERVSSPAFELLMYMRRTGAPQEEMQKRIRHVRYSFMNVPARLYIQNGRTGIDTGALEPLIGIDIDRFRKCEVCYRYFLAARTAQKGCGERCAATIRKRRERERSPETKKRYAQSKKLAAIRRNK